MKQDELTPEEIVANEIRMWARVRKVNRVCIRTLSEYIVAALNRAQLAKCKDRPKIICLCGSTRFKAAFHKAYAELSDAGNIVLTVSRLDPQHNAVSEAQDIIRHELHMRKIDLADELLILNVGGYIGESLSKEIAYAEKIGKLIKYLEETKNEEVG